MEINRKHRHMKDDNFSPVLFIKKDQSCHFQQRLNVVLHYCLIKNSSFWWTLEALFLVYSCVYN